jgi:hypothetical protein
MQSFLFGDCAIAVARFCEKPFLPDLNCKYPRAQKQPPSVLFCLYSTDPEAAAAIFAAKALPPIAQAAFGGGAR